MTEYLKQENIIRSWFLQDELATKKKAISDFIKNKDIPFEIRLKLAIDTPANLRTILDSLITVDDFEEKWTEVDWNLYFDRYQHVTVRDLSFYALRESPMFRKIPEHDRDKAIEEFFEMFLLQGIHGFILDW